MTRRMQALTLIAAISIFVSPMFARYQAKDLNDAVRHELVMLPYYNIFDDLGFQTTPDGVVTLTGDVTWPVVKSDAEHAVKKIPGVTQVVNNIQVLPLSPMDNQIRRAE